MVKKQSIEWEKVFANDMTYKGHMKNINFICKKYKYFMLLNIKKTPSLKKNWQKT